MSLKPRLTPQILAVAIVALGLALGAFRTYVPEAWIADSLKDQALIALQYAGQSRALTAALACVFAACAGFLSRSATAAAFAGFEAGTGFMLLRFYSPVLFSLAIRRPIEGSLAFRPFGWAFPSEYAMLIAAVTGLCGYMLRTHGHRWLMRIAAPAAIAGLALFIIYHLEVFALCEFANPMARQARYVGFYGVAVVTGAAALAVMARPIRTR